MNTRIRFLALCGGWLSVAFIVYLAYAFYYAPKKAEEEVKQQAIAEQEKITATSSDSIYKDQINFALDGFSGYSIFRSPVFRSELSRKSHKLNIQDIGDYAERFRALKSGSCQMGVFTVDALIKMSDSYGEGKWPVSIVAIVDETKGGDAMVAYKDAIPNIDALNDPETKFIATANSPSETLARVVLANFKLNNISQNPFQFLNNSDEVYKAYRNSKLDSKQVFVLWEPDVSKVLENPATHVVISSANFEGYIVDAIVVNRDFLFKNTETVKDFVTAYFKASYHYRKDMKKLVMEDARSLGSALNDKQAENLVNGIWWKNTQENYAHFGMGGTSLQHIQNMIENLTSVLLKTGAIKSDPTNGQPNLLVYDKILTSLHNENFHPGTSTEEKVDRRAELVALSESEWNRLLPVGTLEVPPLVFNRGTFTLNSQSIKILDGVIKTLNTFPQYYLLIEGNASLQGNLEANKKLAANRAKAAQDYLISHGIKTARVKAISGEPTGMTSVRFVLGQVPY